MCCMAQQCINLLALHGCGLPIVHEANRVLGFCFVIGMSCDFYVHDGNLFARLQFLVSEPRKWATSSNISKALAKLKESSQTPACIGRPGNARDGNWLNAKRAPKCVLSQHKTLCAIAMATAAASLQFPWGDDEALPLPSPCAVAPASSLTLANGPTSQCLRQLNLYRRASPTFWQTWTPDNI